MNNTFHIALVYFLSYVDSLFHLLKSLTVPDCYSLGRHLLHIGYVWTPTENSLVFVNFPNFLCRLYLDLDSSSHSRLAPQYSKPKLPLSVDILHSKGVKEIQRLVYKTLLSLVHL
jgi:hypothetical protein